MIRGMLDNDQYKFTMQQALLKLGFGSVPVVYKFKCRDKEIDFSHCYDDICRQIINLQDLSIHPTEVDYMRSLRYFSDEYLSFLKQFRFDPDYVTVSIDDKTGELDVAIKGPWFHTILFEVPILAIISQSYHPDGNYQFADNKLHKKLKLVPYVNNFKFMEFGTRRRKSFAWQHHVINTCIKQVPNNFIGTSNLCLALNTNIKPMGTMAHEWLQAHQQLGYRVGESQKMAFENWVKVYRGDLGIALSDVINTDVFLKDFNDPLFYKLFDGVREDSEPDPIAFGNRIVNFYYAKNIDPLTKTIVFSNGLTFEKAERIYDELQKLIGLSFGIGTNLTNDWEHNALNIVIKMVSCNGEPVAKISNSPGKGMCESPEFVSYLKSVYKID